jgi:cytochrome c oxidase subunit 2
MNIERRRLCFGAIISAGTLVFGGAVAREAAGKQFKERVVRIQAKKFNYTPNEITLKKGEHVILEFTSIDFMHGFSIPDLHIRADLPPGQVTRVRLVPEKVGTYDFLCDNFCGSGHEQMNGKIIVKA